MPRRYTLGKRTSQIDATRTRIVEAAAELYRDQGAGRTTVAQIARAADVAPGTVRNHFGSTEALAEAVAAHVMAALRMPGPETFADRREVPDRVDALAHAMAAYYERSQPWYRIERLDDRPLQAWADARASYDAAFDALVREALGPLASDPDAVAVVAAFLDPGVLGGLWSRGRSMDTAATLVSDVLRPWLEGRAAGGRGRARPPG